LKKFILGQCIIELLLYNVSRRAITVETIRWRRWPPGGIWIEKVLSWTVHN
jgi:hypothetical protein